MTKFYHFVRREDLEQQRIPLGYPMPGVRGLVMEPTGAPCPSGMPGEIVIRTPYAASGYTGDAAEQSGGFCDNPFGADGMYRTGDVGRICPNGLYEILGRMDEQGKVRGIRLEPGEIESLLRSQDQVQDAAVIVATVGNEEQLCAYVVCEGEPDIPAMRDQLADRLPTALIPSVFMVVVEIPRTISGKVDRRALPEPGVTREQLDAEYVAPETPTEEVLVEIWMELLAVDQIGVTDNFFQLGGHSLMATQLVSAIRTRLGVEVPLAAVFEKPTIKQLNTRIEDIIYQEIDDMSDEEADAFFKEISDK